MGLEIFLILIASAGGIAILGAVVYRNVPNRSPTPAKLVEIEKGPVASKVPAAEPTPETEPVSEAPPPFAEDSSPSKRIAAPTDTTAISSAVPFVSIQLPKTVQRSATKMKRKRKTTARARNLQPTAGTAIPSLEPDKREPSAA